MAEINQMLERIKNDEEEAEKYRVLKAQKKKHNDKYNEKLKTHIRQSMKKMKHCETCDKDIKMSCFTAHSKTQGHQINLLGAEKAVMKCELCDVQILISDKDKHEKSALHVRIVNNPDIITRRLKKRERKLKLLENVDT
jgi:hypothetical protein